MRAILLKLIASRIEWAVNNVHYSVSRQHLCLVLSLQIWNPLNWLAISHIRRVLQPNVTLHGHIAKSVPDFAGWPWYRREAVHRKFYTQMVKALRAGDSTYGRIPDRYGLGIVPVTASYRLDCKV